MFDVRVEVAQIRGFCDLPHKVGDWFEVRNGRLYIPAGRFVCIWALGALLPMLPAKERRIAETNDWLPRVELLTCPDPNGLVVWRITQVPHRAAGAAADVGEGEGMVSADLGGPVVGRLAINPELCSGCGECVAACPLAPVRVRIPGPQVCCQCGVSKCIDACPQRALRRGPGGRTVVVDTALCDGCGRCAAACPFGGPVVEDGVAWFCDLCGGWPRCAAACRSGAIVYLPGI